MQRLGYFMAIRSIQWHLVYFMVIWSILWSFGLLCGRLVYFVVVWNIFPVLVCCTKKNLATLQLGRVT
jgi:hypothetical protein